MRSGPGGSARGLIVQGSKLARACQNVGHAAHVHIPEEVSAWLGAVRIFVEEGGSTGGFSGLDIEDPGHIRLVTLGHT